MMEPARVNPEQMPIPYTRFAFASMRGSKQRYKSVMLKSARLLRPRRATAMSDDDIYFSKALAEYRDDSGDDRDFADLEPVVQHEILKRAQALKTQREREKRG